MFKRLRVRFIALSMASLLLVLGVIVALVSFIGVLWALVTALCGKSVAGWASMTCIVCFVSGVQLICLGIIGEYIGKIYLETKQRPRYIISERTWESYGAECGASGAGGAKTAE